MALSFKDRIQETTTTTGTGTITLAGAVASFRTFASLIGVGRQVQYIIYSTTNSEWEAGIGVLATSTTLTRPDIHASSNMNAAVSFSAGTKYVMIALDAYYIRISASTIDAFLTTGEAITSGNFVRIHTDGLIYKVDDTTIHVRKFIGIATESAASGATCAIRMTGRFYEFTNLDSGGAHTFRISATPGSYDSSGVDPIVGWIVNDTTMIINSTGIENSAGIGYRGYLEGGQTSATVMSAACEKISFASNSLFSRTSCNLSVARDGVAAVCDAVEYIYYSGGGTTGSVATTDRLAFSIDVRAARTASDLNTVRRFGAGLSDRSSKGYVGGGDTGTAVLATGFTLSLSTGVFATGPNLPAVRSQPASVSGDSTKGYLAGGRSSSAVTSRLTTVTKMTYSTSTYANIAGVLSQARWACTGLSDGTTKGYVSGGRTTASVHSSVTDKITYSTDAVAVQTSAALNTASAGHGGVSQGSTKGYICGGFSAAAAGNLNSTIITFATDTDAQFAASYIITNRQFIAGSGDTGI